MLGLSLLMGGDSMGLDGENNGFLSLAEAAKVAGVSESTIRRRRGELLSVGAVKGSQGWQITYQQLAAVGLLDSVTATPEFIGIDREVTTRTEQLEARIRELEEENFRLQTRLDAAEEINEAFKARAETAEKTILLLEAPGRKKSWWQRWREHRNSDSNPESLEQ